MQRPVPRARPASRAGFGLGTLIALVMGNAIGAGAYTTSGYALADLGSREWVLLAWAVGGVIALAGAASYGLLARRLTESGGEYLYLARALHPVAGSVAGWVSLLAGFTGAIAFAATALEVYVRAAWPGGAAWPPSLMAIAVIAASGLAHGAGSAGAAVHRIATVAMFVGIAAFLAWAGYGWTLTGWPHDGAPPARAFDLPAFAGSLVWISLSYSGFNAAVYVAGEARDPARDVPRAMVWGTLIIAAVYVALNAAFLYAPAPDAIAGRPEVAAIAAQAIGGRAGRDMIELVIVVSLLTSVTAMVMTGPRVYAKMAADGVLPRVFAARADGGPPRAAIMLQVALACAVVLVSDVRGLLGWLGLTLSLSAALAVATLFRGARPRSAWFPIAPTLFLAATLGFGALSAWRDPAQFAAAAATLGAGAVVYALQRQRRNSAASSR